MTPSDTPEKDEEGGERASDRMADHVPEGMRGTLGSAAEHLVPFGGRMVGEMEQVADEMGKQAADEGRLFDVFDKAIHEQASAVAEGVDMAPITAVEPDFDPVSFRTLARETFFKVREARGSEDKHEADALLNPAMQNELNRAIDDDVAAHRHHIFSALELEQATIVSAAVAAGREKLGVHFVIDGRELERDDTSDAIVAGSPVMHRWAELWQFERDPSVDASATDEQHALSFGPDEWLFSHRGWVVTDIQRLNEPLPQPDPDM